MKTFEVTFTDCRRFKRVIYVEGANKATLELGLSSTLGMAGCELLSIEEASQEVY